MSDVLARLMRWMETSDIDDVDVVLRDAITEIAGLRARLHEHRIAAQRLAEQGGCPPQLDCGADRKSVASQRCRDTGGQPFDSAPTTTLTDAEREAVAAAIESCEHGADFNDQRIYPATAQRLRERAATLRGLLERLGGGR